MSTLDALFGRLLAILNAIACSIIMLLTLLICIDVIGRGVFNHPVPGVPEIARFAVLVMFWMQMPFTLRAGRHIRSGLYLDRAGPRGRAVVEVLNALIGIAVFIVIAWWAIPEFLTVLRNNDFEGAPPVLIPLWPIWAVFILGAALTGIQYLIIAVRALTGHPPYIAQATTDPELDTTA